MFAVFHISKQGVRWGQDYMKYPGLGIHVVYHLHGKPIRFEIMLMGATIPIRNSVRNRRFPFAVRPEAIRIKFQDGGSESVDFGRSIGRH